MDSPTIFALVCFGLFMLWAAYSHGHSTGFWDGCDSEADRWRERIDDLRRERTRERARERAAGDDLLARHARQRLRLRGVLREARRWKAVAVSLGWKRPRSPRLSARPLTVFLPPQPEGTDMEALGETVRRIVESTPKGGGV